MNEDITTKNKKYQELDEDRFYSEVDEKRSHGSCCTFQSLILFFIITFILIVLGVFAVYKQITNNKIKFNLPNIAISLDEVKNKFSKLDFAGNSIEISLSEEELSALVKDGFNIESMSLKNLQTTIDPKQILIYGDLFRPINSKLVMQATPEIRAGRIYFKVEKIKAVNINLPNFIAKRYSESLSENLANKVNIIYNNFSVEEVILDHKKMLIKGKKK